MSPALSWSNLASVALAAAFFSPARTALAVGPAAKATQPGNPRSRSSAAKTSKPKASKPKSNPKGQAKRKVMHLTSAEVKAPPKSSATNLGGLDLRPKPIAKAALGEAFGANLKDLAFARLTPGSPEKKEQAVLVLVRPNVVEGQQDYAEFSDRCVRDTVWALTVIRKKHIIDGNVHYTEKVRRRKIKRGEYCPPAGAVVLWLYAPANSKLAVDCSVVGIEASEGPDKWLVSLDGRTPANFGGSLPFDNHLMLTVTSHEAGWRSVRFRSTLDQWRFYGCDVYAK